MNRRNRLRYGFVTSLTNVRNALRTGWYGIERNQLTMIRMKIRTR